MLSHIVGKKWVCVNISEKNAQERLNKEHGSFQQRKYLSGTFKQLGQGEINDAYGGSTSCLGELDVFYKSSKKEE